MVEKKNHENNYNYNSKMMKRFKTLSQCNRVYIGFVVEYKKSLLIIKTRYSPVVNSAAVKFVFLSLLRI